MFKLSQMVKQRILITLFVLLVVFTRSFAQPPTGSFEKIKVHPRLLLLKGEEERVRVKLANDATYNFLHTLIIKECNALLATPPVERTFSGGRLLTTARENRRRIFFLSYAFRVTGDQSYCLRAEQEMLAAAKFIDWNPSHFLDPSEFTMGLAIGYDWLYDALSPETKAVIAEAIVSKGLLPSLQEGNSAWATATHNWNQVCNASMSYGAIAVMEKYPELARKILKRAVSSVILPMNEYMPDGAYPEGYGYWAYGTSFNVMLISALERAFDSDFGLGSHSGFLKTPYYMLNMTGSSGLPFNYSDCDAKSLLNPAMAWFAAKTNDPSLLAEEFRIMHEQKTHLHRIRELPAMMVWGLDIDFSNIPRPASLVWVGHGKTPVALMRTSWERGDGIFVGIKGGKATTAHAHMDAGSFVVDAMGERWALDFGPQDYYSLQSKGIKLFTMRQESDRWNVFRISNMSHNTLIFDRRPHNVEGSARIVSTTDSPVFRSATVDMTDVIPESRKVLRGVAIAEDRYVVIRDEIELRNASSIRWNMLTDAQVSIIDNKTAELSKNGKKMILRISEPSDAVFTTWSTDPPQPFDAPNPGTTLIGFEVKRNPSKPFSFTVLMVPGDASLENKMAIPVLSEWPLISPLK